MGDSEVAATTRDAHLQGVCSSMSYFEDRKAELEGLLSTLRKEKEVFKATAERERQLLDEKATSNKRLAEGVIQMAKQRQIGFPWLAEAYDELLRLEEYKLVRYLTDKKNPALSASEVVKEQSRRRREAEKQNKIAQYLVSYYENIAPFLVDLKEEVDIATEQERELLKEYSEEELEDATTLYLSKEEYRKLPSVERNQMALDRFWKRPKSKWLIGRLYERYVGYLYEKEGYSVDYHGIFQGFEDLGRDLICRKGDDLVVIQCKNWSQFRTIYEKHIFQFFGTVFQFKDENPNKNVRAVFYTSTNLSDLARRFAKELSIELREGFKFDNSYPVIKCNISKADKARIYHLPFDQQYDKVKIETEDGEFYAGTVKEAEDAGFRRAFRYSKLGIKKN